MAPVDTGPDRVLLKFPLLYSLVLAAFSINCIECKYL